MPAWHHVFMEAQRAIVLMGIMTMVDVFYIICIAIIITSCFNLSMQHNESNRKPHVIHKLVQYKCLKYKWNIRQNINYTWIKRIK